MTGVQFLHNVSLFANLPVSELEPIAERLVNRRYRKGETIFSQGSPGNSLFIVKSGLVEIVVTDPSGRAQRVAECGTGQVFGEFGLLDGLPRSAGAIAREASELLSLSRPDFFIHLERHPNVAVNLLVLISRRLRFMQQRAEPEHKIIPPLVRLVQLLTDFGDRYGESENGTLRLPLRLTMGEVAGMMGCPRSEAEAAIQALCEKGLVEWRGLQLTLCDLEGLRALAIA